MSRRSLSRVGVDVGGTFTDLFFYDEASRSFKTGKVPSNRGNEAVGFLDGLRKWGLKAHIKSLYRLHGSEDALVEALSLIMWPVGVNHFLDACGVWTELMASGAVTPCERYRAWAETPRQGGHPTRWMGSLDRLSSARPRFLTGVLA